MKTAQEIWDKIYEYREKEYDSGDKITEERYYTIVDTLLWVIGDKSGASI